MKVIRSLAIYAAAGMVLTPLAGISGVRADDADLVQIRKTLQALEARVATLESEKQQYRREAASAKAEAQALKQKLGSKQPSPTPPLQLPPSGSYAMATKAPLLAAVPTWGGFYAGASFGLASQHANRDDVDSTASTQTIVTGTFSSTNVSSDVFTPSLSGRGPGAMANLFLGYNYMLPGDYLVGGQIEGGVSNMRTRLTGPSSDLEQSLLTVNNAGAITTQTVTSQDSGNTTGHLDNRWAMAALVRGGLVVDPKDLVYLIGGLSYGRFEFANDDQTFGAFGGTVGAGWERKITPSWTLKAEYRYTRFQDLALSTNFASTFSQTTNFVGGMQTFTRSIAGVDNNRLSGLDWHTLTIGVSHYFDTY
ncbi:MAG TPA: outer membrane beta-barrel protein [Bradyrhizobium sp.]|nr:outer membrane beta-barrel protein [Bradyrhizobium sp.]